MTRQDFEKKGFVHLQGFLDKQVCNELVLELNKLVKNKKTIKDEQCPLSESIHGSPVFEKLLEDLTPYFEQASGLKLFPTFAYARLYGQQGEELKIHRDRQACEISASITLGFDGNVWSIYVCDNEEKVNPVKIDMEIGDAVLYKGCDLWHWREKYIEGKWQAQVFLHYVNQDGIYSNWKYDKRDKLSHHKNENYLNDFYVLKNFLSHEFCDNIINQYSKDEVEKNLPEIGGIDGNVDLEIRNVKRVFLPANKGIAATLTSAGLNINHKTYKYNITHSNQTEFLMYEQNGKYKAHTDMFHEHSENTRKLTCLAFLNDDFEGGKFFIQTSYEKIYPFQEKGSIVIFPSYMLHGVEDVIKGNRFTVVTWLEGSYFK